MFLRLNLSLLLLGISLFSGCNTGTRDVTQESPYQAFADRRYRTKVDLYLYSIPEGKGPYIGINDGARGNRDLMLPKEISAQHIGRRHNNALILEIVPAGTELFVTNIFRDVSSQGVVVWFVCDLTIKGRRVSNVSTTFIQSNINGRDNLPPEIDPSLAERME
jgi:hypothetical protein